MESSKFDKLITALKELDLKESDKFPKIEVRLEIEGSAIYLDFYQESQMDGYTSFASLNYNFKGLVSVKAPMNGYNKARDNLVERLENIKKFFDELC